MKRYILTISLLSAILVTSNAQENVTANVSRTENETTVQIDKNYVLLYEEPIDGSITFKDKTFAKAKLNIDLLKNEILFLNADKTQIPMDKQDEVLYFNIGQDLFFNTSKGIIQVIANTNNIKLGISRSFKTSNIEQSGAYGMSSATASTTQYSSYFCNQSAGNPTLTKLSVEQKIDLNYSENFFLIKNNKYNLIKNVKQFSKVFNIDKKELEDFVAQNNTDFKNQENLLQLMNYCTSKIK